MKQTINHQRGSVILGIIIGVVLGLGIALAVAVYVTKVPIPFLNKGGGRTAEQDAAESRKNRDWDPNAPLYGKNPAKPLPPAPGIIAPPPPVAVTPAPPSAPFVTGPSTAAADPSLRPPAVVANPTLTPKPAPKPAGTTADPLGELAAARSSNPGADPFLYFVQVGAFRTPEDAEAQRAKVSLMGVEAKVTEREQSGRQVFRVRVGPFDRKDDADRNKDKLEAGGVETALVRVQR